MTPETYQKVEQLKLENSRLKIEVYNLQMEQILFEKNLSSLRNLLRFERNMVGHPLGKLGL